MTTAVDILFEPLTNIPAPVPLAQGINGGDGIMRYPGAVSAYIDTRFLMKLYTDLATEIIDHAVAELPLLQHTRRAPGMQQHLDLINIVERFYHGVDDM